jgi:hypothetical protein
VCNTHTALKSLRCSHEALSQGQEIKRDNFKMPQIENTVFKNDPNEAKSRAHKTETLGQRQEDKTFCSFCYLALMGFELRASCLLGRCSTI